MEDYVSRLEFNQAIEALRRELTIRGDDQTIAVDGGTGGQVVRSMQTLTPEAETSVTTYTNVSYDSGTNKFTVTFNRFPFSEVYDFIGADGGRIENIVWNNDGDTAMSAATYIFDAPVSGNDIIYFYAFRSMVDSPTTVGRFIIGWVSSDATTSDADTLEYEKSTAPSRFLISSLIINSDGTYTVNDFLDSNDTPVLGRVRSFPELYISKSAKTINLTRMFDRLTGDEFTDTYVYSEPMTESIIIGYTQSTGSISLDVSSNSGSYDDFQVIGYVEIDASNNVQRFLQYDRHAMSLITPFGYTGNVTTSGGTIKIKNGQIYDVT